MMLVRAGHVVEEAPNGDVGLRKYPHFSPDLVITDILMPEKEGLETIQAIRKADPRAKIIAISGGGARGDMNFLFVAKKLGAQKVLPKPIERKAFIAAVNEVLNGSIQPL
jgi:YesN/AraC family two-component response regulator